MPPRAAKKIEAMLADNPADTFLRYSLALEREKEGDHERSLAGLAELAATSLLTCRRFSWPPSSWSSFRASTKPARMLRDGIEAARVQGNAHAAGEMSEMLTQLGVLG